jgi:hypothetical protein
MLEQGAPLLGTVVDVQGLLAGGDERHDVLTRPASSATDLELAHRDLLASMTTSCSARLLALSSPP